MGRRLPAGQKTDADSEFLKRVGRIIKIKRDASGLTREQVSEAAGISTSMLAQLELYGTKSMSIDRAKRICDAIGYPLEYVLAEATSKIELRRAIIETFRDSPWCSSEKVSDDELAWLATIPLEQCVGIRPSPRAIFHLIEARRVSS
jgi:transcriptional regulator with XRE-family HTH domain